MLRAHSIRGQKFDFNLHINVTGPVLMSVFIVNVEISMNY